MICMYKIYFNHDYIIIMTCVSYLSFYIFLISVNLQGSSITVAMDQARQAIQMCGKLLFGQMQEIVNVSMNNGLPPNLNGSDVNTDFGYKGMDTAMASYMSELDFLTNNMSNHVLSAELHNQASAISF